MNLPVLTRAFSAAGKILRRELRDRAKAEIGKKPAKAKL